MSRIFYWAILVCLCVVFRLLPHPPSFSPVFALALYAGHRLKLPVSWGASLIPVVATDFILGGHELMMLVYFNLFLNCLIGKRFISQKTWSGPALSSFLSATIFYLSTNIGVWWTSGLYSLDAKGLTYCLLAGVPFYGNHFLSTWGFIYLFVYLVEPLFYKLTEVNARGKM